MSGEVFDQVCQAVRALTPAEQWRLRKLLDVWLAPPEAALSEEELDQELMREGVLDQVPAPLTDPSSYEAWTPVSIQGKPISETILEERR
jgi:hypothetical protein